MRTYWPDGTPRLSWNERLVMLQTLSVIAAPAFLLGLLFGRRVWR